MSVINQMLKDLEKRSSRPNNPEISFSGLFSEESSDGSEIRYKIGIFIVSFVLIAMMITLLFYHPVFKTDHSIPQPSSDTLSPNNEQTNTLVKPVLVNTTDSQQAASILTGMTLQVQDDMTYLRFSLNQDTFYRVNTNQNQTKLNIELDHTNLIANLPVVDYLKSAINGMEMSNDKNGNLHIALTLNNGSQLQYLDLVDSSDKSPELQINIKSKQNKEPATEKKVTATTAITSIKKPIELFNIELQLKNALNIAASGQKDKAMQLLMDLMTRYPAYQKARESLVALLMENGYLYNAKKILADGLSQDPNYIPFIELKARLLINEGKSDSALHLLQRANPPIQNFPDYYSMMAALYQRQGNAVMAAKVYQQLLSIQSNKAVWWVGLAVALESQGRTTEAKEAYTRASASSGLNPTLTAFVQTRIESG